MVKVINLSVVPSNLLGEGIEASLFLPLLPVGVAGMGAMAVFKEVMVALACAPKQSGVNISTSPG